MGSKVRWSLKLIDTTSNLQTTLSWFDSQICFLKDKFKFKSKKRAKKTTCKITRGWMRILPSKKNRTRQKHRLWNYSNMPFSFQHPFFSQNHIDDNQTSHSKELSTTISEKEKKMKNTTTTTTSTEKTVRSY